MNKLEKDFNLMSDLNDLIYDEEDLLFFHSSFNLLTDGFSSKIELEIDGSTIDCLSDDSEKGGDEEKDDYRRTDKQQIIYELEIFKSRFEKILDKVKKHLDK